MKAYAKANNSSYGNAMSRAQPSYHVQCGGILHDAQVCAKTHKVTKHNAPIGEIGAVSNQYGYGKHC